MLHTLYGGTVDLAQALCFAQLYCFTKVMGEHICMVYITISLFELIQSNQAESVQSMIACSVNIPLSNSAYRLFSHCWIFSFRHLNLQSNFQFALNIHIFKENTYYLFLLNSLRFVRGRKNFDKNLKLSFC